MGIHVLFLQESRHETEDHRCMIDSLFPLFAPVQNPLLFRSRDNQSRNTVCEFKGVEVNP